MKKSVCELEYAKLVAACNELRIALASTRQSHMDFVPALNKTAKQVLDETSFIKDLL